MARSPPLTSTLEARTGLTADQLARPSPQEQLEPLPTILPPEGVTAFRLRDVATRVRPMRPGRLDVSGVTGCVGPALAAAIAREGRHVVIVTGDLDAARRVAQDVAFFGRGASDDDAEDTGQGDVLVFAANESSPYADVNPDRRAAMSRMATLFHLAHDRSWSVWSFPR